MRGTRETLDHSLRWVLIGMLAIYRSTIGPLLGPACRFEPSCSRYAGEAIDRHGPMLGTWLSIKRICRCHPRGGHGYDPVPEAIE